MQNLQELDEVALVDMLAQCTQRFTQLFRNFTENDPEYQDCKSTIHYLTSELERRRGKERGSMDLNSISKQDGAGAPAIP